MWLWSCSTSIIEDRDPSTHLNILTTRGLAEARNLYRGKREKIVERVSRTVERQLADPATAGEISLRRSASGLYVSPGYLGRIFHHATGTTLERFVMIKRVELAKKLLLDPAVSVASVSNRCGFSEPTYLARVFRKLAGCSPSEYASNPRP